MRRWLLCGVLISLSCCGKPADPKSATAALENASKQFEAGNVDAAKTEVETALKADAGMSEAHFLAAKIAERQNDLQKALNEYVKADAAGPGTNKARLAAAALLLKVRSYDLASEWIARCLADRPSDRAMRSYRALLAQRQGDFAKARADAEAVLTEDRNDGIANAVLAEQALRRRDVSGALAKIDAGLSKDGADRTLLLLKADAFSEQQLFDKAIEIYRALVDVDPAMAEYRRGLAELIAKSSGVDQGEQVLRSGVAVAPDNVDMRLQLISFLERHRTAAAVEEELMSSTKRAPQMAVYDIALADHYNKRGQYQTAKQVLQDTIKRVSSEAAKTSAQLALARILLSHDELQAARAILDTLSKTKPENDEILALRGQLKLKTFDSSSAVQDFLTLAAHQPGNANAYLLLADAYLAEAKYKESIAALRRVMVLRPADFALVARIVDVAVAFGDFSAASRTIDDFLGQNPDSLEARALRVRVAVAGKDWTAAATQMINVRSLPDSARTAVQLDAETKEALKDYGVASERYNRLIFWGESPAFDGNAAQSFIRASILAGRAVSALDELTRMQQRISQGDQPVYKLLLAQLYDSSHQPKQAYALVAEAIAQNPRSVAPYVQQAQALARRSQIDDALAFLQRGLDAGAPNEPLLLARAQIQRSAGQVDEAIETYREVLRVNPRSIVGANEYANLLADQRPKDLEMLRQARELIERNAAVKNQAIVDTMAWLSYRLGDYQKAKDLLGQANSEQSSDPLLKFHYGAVLIATGEPMKGRKMIDETLTQNYPGRDEAKRLVER
jgi:tetratricopeptide (TPR) repeat protein